MIKTLYICRLFSGLEESINKKSWNPTGVPTIYKIIDKLKYKNKNFKLILTIKDGYSKLKENKTKQYKIPGFLLPVTVLKGTQYNVKLRFIKNIYREVYQFLNILRLLIVFKPNLIYIDNSNIWSAGLLARFTGIPVVFRVMGVYQNMHSIFEKRPSLLESFLIWLYRAPFKLVICTQDGSGVEDWIRKAINPDVKKQILLNGIPKNIKNTKPILPFQEKTIYITFLGKLEHAKGAEQFVNAMISVLKKAKDKRITINIIGFGSLRNKVITKTKKNNIYDKFRFIERIPNKSILPILKKTDIYISLNRAGNLSNANLEAIAARCCIIIPKSQKKYGIDKYTDKILSKETVCRIKSTDDVSGLIKETLNLIYNKSLIEKKKKSIEAIGRSLKNWNERIETEIKALKSIFE